MFAGRARWTWSSFFTRFQTIHGTVPTFILKTILNNVCNHASPMDCIRGIWWNNHAPSVKCRQPSEASGQFHVKSTWLCHPPAGHITRRFYRMNRNSLFTLWVTNGVKCISHPGLDRIWEQQRHKKLVVFLDWFIFCLLYSRMITQNGFEPLQKNAPHHPLALQGFPGIGLNTTEHEWTCRLLIDPSILDCNLYTWTIQKVAYR